MSSEVKASACVEGWDSVESTQQVDDDGGGDSCDILNGGDGEQAEEAMEEEEEEDADWPICVITSTSGGGGSSSVITDSASNENSVKEEHITTAISPRIDKQPLQPETNGTNNGDGKSSLKGKPEVDGKVKINETVITSPLPKPLPLSSAEKQQANGDPAKPRRPSIGGVLTYCDVCGTAFLKPEQLENHLKERHPEKCSTKSDEKIVSTPAEVKEDNKLVVAKAESTMKKDAVEVIVAAAAAIPPPPQPFICNLCGKKFLIKANWEDHQKVHHHGFSSPSTSSTAPKSVASPLSAPEGQRHTSPVKPPPKKGPPYECELCDKKFPLPFLLRKHMFIHNKPYQCAVCMERFIKIEGLNLHKRLIHDVAGMSTFKCMVCGKNDFLLLSDMYTHRMEKHSQVPFQGEREKPFGCAICQKPYQRKGDALVCAVLGHDPASLREAMFQHKCPECVGEEEKLGFHSIRALKRHWLKEHPDKLFPEDVLLSENGYSYDAPLPSVEIDKREAYDLKEKGPPQAKTGDTPPLILEFDNLTETEEEGGNCIVPVFACPDCPLTFIDVDSLRIHEQVHLQDEGPPEAGTGLSKKRGRPKRMGAEGSSPIPISLLPPQSNFIRGKHLIPKFGCVVCGQKFRKLKRLRDHEQTHLAMDPSAPVFPKVFGRKGRKPGLIKKKIHLLPGGFSKKRGRPRKVSAWESSPTSVGETSPTNDDDASKMNYVPARPFHCKVCPATFNLPKSLRMHELNVHKAPHRRPGRKPGMKNTTVFSTNLANGEANAESSAQGKSEESSGPPPLAPGRIRVGRLEISTKFNKMIKQSVPIKICVTGENGEKTYHFQCPKCPKVFRDRRGIHLHILGHSLKTSVYQETELKQRSEEAVEEEPEETRPSPSSISSSSRRTSDRERRVPSKLSEYEVDDEEGAEGAGDVEKSSPPTTAVAEESPPQAPDVKKKEGRGRPRKHPLPIVNHAEGRESLQGPSMTFQEISGEIVRKWPGRPAKAKQEMEISDESEDEQGETRRRTSHDDTPPPPPFEKPLCKICGKTFDSVMDLWYHGNQEHYKSTKVKYVPKVEMKSEEPKKPVIVSPKSNQNPVKKNPAVLALLQKKRAQGAIPTPPFTINIPPPPPVEVKTTETMTKTEVKKEVSEGSAVPGNDLTSPSTSTTDVDSGMLKRKERVTKRKLSPEPAAGEEKQSTEVSRIGQLKIPAKFRNKEVLKQEKPLIITETREDGSTVRLFKCRRCPKTFRDMRGFPFHSLCHLVMSEKKNPSNASEDGGNGEVGGKKKKENGGGQEAVVRVPKKQGKKVPGLIPLSGIKNKDGEKNWIVNQTTQKISPPIANGIIKKTEDGQTAAVEKKGERVPSTSRTSSIPGGAKQQSSSENATPDQLFQQQAVLTKPVLSPTSNEFRFKIIKQSVILPFKKRRGRPSTKYLNYMKGTQKALVGASASAPSSASKSSPSPKGNDQQSGKASGEVAHDNQLKQSVVDKSQPEDNPVSIEAVRLTAISDTISSKLLAPVASAEVVTSLQLDEEHGLHQKKKVKLAAMLAKAESEESPPPRKITSNGSAAGESGGNSQKESKKIDARSNEETKSDKPTTPMISPEKAEVSDASTSQSSSPATLKRKRGRPRKDESIPPTPSTSVDSSASENLVDEVKPVKGMSFSKWPDKEEIEVSKEDMEALKREMEKNAREVMESVVVTSAPTVNSESTPSTPSSTGKKRGRRPKSNTASSKLENLEENGTVKMEVENTTTTPTPTILESVKKEEESSVVLKSVQPSTRKSGRAGAVKRSVEQSKDKLAVDDVATKVQVPSEIQEKEMEACPNNPSSAEETSSPPIKRGRGRPRKSDVPTPDEELLQVPIPIKIFNSTLSPDITSFGGTGDEDGENGKRRRGRPRKSMPILTRADNEDGDVQS